MLMYNWNYLFLNCDPKSDDKYGNMYEIEVGIPSEQHTSKQLTASTLQDNLNEGLATSCVFKGDMAT